MSGWYDGMLRKTRVFKDEDALVTAIRMHVPKFSSVSNRDCVRLGKYKANPQPRPIIVTFNKAAHVTCVLSTHFPRDRIRVQPDLLPGARNIRAFLLAECRILID